MSTGQILVQAFVLIIVIGGIYSLWRTTQAYGGLIGSGLKWIGAGIVLFSIEALDRVLGPFSVVDSITYANPEIVHNLILLFGLLFSAIGFSKLTKITKQK